MAKKEKLVYPDPKFFRAKDNMNWKRQGENLAEVGAIFWDMLKETDWQQYGKDCATVLKSDWERIKGEYKDFMALDNSEKWDRVVNGERSRWPPSAASGAASRTPPMTSGSGRVCGACCSAPSPRI